MPGTKTTVNNASTSQNGSRKRPDRAGSGAAALPSKRIRVSRACDQCRAGREKCDGIQPTCNACQVQERPCTYNEQPKKRGIQPNYIRTLELTLTWILTTFPETEARLSEQLPDTRGDAHTLIAFKDATKSEELHQVWRSGLVCRQIDQMLSGASIESPETSRSDEVLPARLEEANSRPKPTPLAQEIPELLRADMEMLTAATLPMYDTVLTYDHASSSEPDIRLLKLPRDSWSLLEHYFAFTQSWMPITEKHDILKLMYKYPSEGLAPAAATSGDHAELWSLMALSASQKASQIGAADVESLLEVARHLVSRGDTAYELGHVKALLIQSVLEIDREAWLGAWLAVGSAVRILTFLTSDVGQSRLLQIGRARHTFLAAFVLESTIAAHIGAHTHLHRSLVREIGLPIEDGLEEWSPWKDPSAGPTDAMKSPVMAISTFNKLVAMAEQLHGRNRSAGDFEQSRSRGVNTILQLTRNAALVEGRQQPSLLVAAGDMTAVTDKSRTGPNQSETIFSPSDVYAWASKTLSSHSIAQPESTPFLSIPNLATDSAPGSTPAMGHSKTDSPGQLSTGYTQSQNWDFDMENGDLFGTSIFEELASLERADESARPQFMQNLGFGPDLDLAEFFGADYQLSDPMLAHLQT